LPLAALHLLAKRALACLPVHFGRAQVDEGDRVPRRAPGERRRPGFGRSGGELSRGLAQRSVDGGGTDATKPVLGVVEVACAAVHDAVPEASFGCINFLADAMGLVQIVEAQPETRVTSGCHSRVAHALRLERLVG